MLYGLINMYRLARAGVTLIWHGVQVWPASMNAPAPTRWVRRMAAPVLARRRAERKASRLSGALAALGPAISSSASSSRRAATSSGRELASDLANLQDRLPPFPMNEARRAIRDAFGAEPDQLFATFGEPVAAASIAQVHKATVREADGTRGSRRGQNAAARRRKALPPRSRQLLFRRPPDRALHPPSRRLRPVAVVDTLARLDAAWKWICGWKRRRCPRWPRTSTRRRSGLPRAEGRLDAHFGTRDDH